MKTVLTLQNTRADTEVYMKTFSILSSASFIFRDKVTSFLEIDVCKCGVIFIYLITVWHTLF